MKKVDTVVLNSNGNITSLVVSECKEKEHALIAKKIMKKSSFQVEQVGFAKQSLYKNADAKLSMAGNEFCGNAVASLGAYLTEKRTSKNNEELNFKFEVSGSDDLTTCSVQKKDSSYIASVSLPLPVKIEKKIIYLQEKNLDLDFIYYKGIQTIVINTEKFTDLYKKIANNILDKYNNELYSLTIVTLFSAKKQKILPLVCVPFAKTRIWENSCALASASSVISLSNNKKITMGLNINQATPSCIRINVAYEHSKLQRVIMQEKVFIVSHETIHIDNKE